MRVLIVGGAFQGKRAHGMAHWPELPRPLGDGGLHLPVRDWLERGLDPREELLARLEELEHWLLLCDEVGGGVVPVDAFDREWREAVGRLCCELAGMADVVERMVCGVPQRIKG